MYFGQNKYTRNAKYYFLNRIPHYLCNVKRNQKKG